MSLLKETKAESLADALVERFERQILSGDLKPGARFPTEKTITEDFAVSRTVVREAFARLAARGLLTSRRGSGAYVAETARYRAFQITADEMREIDDVLKLLEMRIALEGEMATLAAERRTAADLAAMRDALAAMSESEDMDASVAADARFHGAIAHATRNSYYVRITEFLGVRFVPSRKLYLGTNDEDAHRAYAAMINRDHEAILDAIAAQDAQGAREAARRHMEKSYQRYEALRHAP